MLPTDLKISAEQAHEKEGFYGWSFWAVPGLTAEEIATVVGTSALPHSVMRCATTGALRALGYEVDFRGREHHVSLVLSSAPSDTDCDNLDRVFGPPAPNPVARGRL
jgi:hypothetical protein